MEKIEKLQPRAFTRFCMTIGAVPSSYLEGMTVERQLLWFCSYLENEVIPAVNNNAGAVEELQALYTQLKDYVDHYFDNLDVQEEINNKLDEMAESGQLTDIIAQYLQLAGVLAYDTKAQMKAATNLVDGSIAKTLGNLSYSDGQGAFYKVREIQNTDVVDDENIIALSDPDLIAEKIIDLKIKGFDSVSLMKTSNNLKNGDIVKSLGYYSTNDGGGAFYKIRTKTNDDVIDEGSIVELYDTNLVAELIIENDTINVRTFGCKGDNTTDDTTKLQNAIDFARTKKATTYIPAGEYKITSTLTTQAQTIKGESPRNTFIKPSGCDGILINYDSSGINKGIYNLSVYCDTLQTEYAGIIFEERNNNTRNHNVVLDNLGFRNLGCAIYTNDCHRCTFQNIGIWDCFMGLNIERKTVQCSFINICDNCDIGVDVTSTRFGTDNIGARVGTSSSGIRPEGIKFTQCCFTNHNIGLYLDYCLLFNAYQCEFDICRKKCIYIANVDGGCVINGCWLNLTGSAAINGVEIRTVQLIHENTVEILNNIITATNIGEENTCSAIKTMDDYFTGLKIIGNEIKNTDVVANQFDYGIFCQKTRKAMVQNNNVYNCKTQDLFLSSDIKNSIIANSGLKIRVIVFEGTKLYAYANMFSTVSKVVAGTLIGELEQ